MRLSYIQRYKIVRNTFKDATIRETVEKLHEHSRHLTWEGEEKESSDFMNALESITSNGQCSIVFKNYSGFNYDSWMDHLMQDFDVCKGMISA